MNNGYPTINGVACSWADASAQATPDGGSLINLEGVSAISSSRSVEVGEQQGLSGGRVTRRTTGKVSYEASITFYRNELQNFLRALKVTAKQLGLVRGNQVAISLVPWGFQVQHTPLGSVELFDRRWKGCRYLGDTHDLAEGTDAQTIEVPISVIEIVDMIDGEEVVLL